MACARDLKRTHRSPKLLHVYHLPRKPIDPHMKLSRSTSRAALRIETKAIGLFLILKIPIFRTLPFGNASSVSHGLRQRRRAATPGSCWRGPSRRYLVRSCSLGRSRNSLRCHKCQKRRPLVTVQRLLCALGVGGLKVLPWNTKGVPPTDTVKVC